MIDFFDSTFFNTLIVLITGIAVFGVYFKNRWDEKRQAACIIVIEIRQAENLISQFKSHPLDLAITPLLMSTNNWERYKHFFVENLDFDCFNAIDTFYRNCILMDKCIGQLSVFIQSDHKNNATHHTISQLAKEAKDEKEFVEKREAYLNVYNKDSTIQVSNNSLENFRKLVNNTSYILTTPAGEKLKKIAKMDKKRRFLF